MSARSTRRVTGVPGVAPLMALKSPHASWTGRPRAATIRSATLSTPRDGAVVATATTVAPAGVPVTV